MGGDLCGSGSITDSVTLREVVNCTVPITGHAVKIVTTEEGKMFLTNVRIGLTGMLDESQYLGRATMD